jgi:hypothetical protein
VHFTEPDVLSTGGHTYALFAFACHPAPGGGQSKPWTLHKRFSDFAALRDELLAERSATAGGSGAGDSRSKAIAVYRCERLTTVREGFDVGSARLADLAAGAEIEALEERTTVTTNAPTTKTTQSLCPGYIPSGV